MTSSAPRSVLVELLAEPGGGYLRYLHVRHAIELAGVPRSVLVLDAGSGSFTAALARAFPGASFTFGWSPKRRAELELAKASLAEHGVENAATALVDPLVPPPDLTPHDLVVAREIVRPKVRPMAMVDALSALSTEYVLAMAPFADRRTRREARKRAKEQGEANPHVGALDAIDLLSLFPTTVAVRGIEYEDAGGLLRTRVAELGREGVVEEVEALVALAERDVRRGWPRTTHEAAGVWVLGRVCPQEPRRVRASGVEALSRFASRWLGRMAPAAPRPSTPPPRRGRVFAPHELLEVSGFFDAEYYRSRYPDVAAAHVDPLDHYVLRGAREGRWPNEWFDSRAYAKAASIDLSRVNPAVHYLKSGVVAYARGAASDALFAASEPRGLSGGSRQPTLDLRRLAVTIVMPIHDGGDHVRRAIESVRSSVTLPDVELLLIDDASTDAALVRDLDRYACMDRVSLLRNPVNLGFTRSVNRGLEHARVRRRDAVLLNSDTRTAGRWLEALASAAHEDPRIATATALSDSAGAFSTPLVGPNDTLTRMSLDHATRASRRAARVDVERVPTGNGFCMYVRHDAIEDVGLFDADRFPTGYGEENDFCLRATERGYRHVLALRSYVHHVNAVSFGASKSERVRAAREVLDALHPDYGEQLRAGFDAAVELAAQREAFARVIAAQRSNTETNPPCPRVLYVASSAAAPIAGIDSAWLRGIAPSYQPLVLTCDSCTMTLSDASASPPVVLAMRRLNVPIDLVSHASGEYDEVLGEWLRSFDVERMHVIDLAMHGLGVIRVARRHGIPVIASIRDGYVLHPSRALDVAGAGGSPVAPSDWTAANPDAVRAAHAMAEGAFLTIFRRRSATALRDANRVVSATELLARSVEASLGIRSDVVETLADPRTELELLRSLEGPSRFGTREARRALGLRPRVGIVARGAYPTTPPTVHVRIASVLEVRDGSVEYEWVDAQHVARSGATEFDFIVVCRDAAAPEVLDALVVACTAARTPWVVDLDDDLLNVPADKDVGGTYARAAPSMRRLLEGARCVFASTEELARRLGDANGSVRVVPNRLLASRWLAPLVNQPEVPDLGERPALRLLYVGSRTHKEDLDLIEPAIQRARSERGFVLHVVGVDRESRDGVVRLEPPSTRYDDYVPWLRALAPHFDVALAPLVDHEFNRAKSHLKFLEYAAIGVPVVASAVGPYAAIIRDAIDGLLVPNEPDAWFEALTRLADDSALRERLARSARARVEAEFVHTSCHFDALALSVEAPAEKTDG